MDFIKEDAKLLGRKMGRNDARKVTEYLEGIRSIERRIQRLEQLGSREQPDIELPDGKPKDYSEHIRLMYDMMVIALQTDSTRVASFLLAHDGSNRSFNEIGVSEGHHTISHHQRNPEKLEKIAKIDKFYVEQFGYFPKQMSDTKDIDGKSLLDLSLIHI